MMKHQKVFFFDREALSNFYWATGHILLNLLEIDLSSLMERHVFLSAVPPVLAQLLDLLPFFNEESFNGLFAIHREIPGATKLVCLNGTCTNFYDFFHVKK